MGCSPSGQMRLNGSNRNTSAGKKKKKRNARDFFNRNTYRKTPQTIYYEEIGHAIVGICEAVPDGVVVFVPSYAKLRSMVKCWKRADYNSGSMSIWDRLSNVKMGSDIVVEPKNTILSSRNSGSDDVTPMTLEEAHEKYASGVYSGDGALMLAVFRGKMSEGMDLKDSMVRGVRAWKIVSIQRHFVVRSALNTTSKTLEHQHSNTGTLRGLCGYSVS